MLLSPFFALTTLPPVRSTGTGVDGEPGEPESPPRVTAAALGVLKWFMLISSSFHEKLYNRGPAHTTPGAGLASTGHVASFNSALAAEASLDPR